MEPDPALPPILIVDDDPHDRFFLQHRLDEAEIRNPVIEFQDGDEAIELLQRTYGENCSTGTQLPCVIFTDLKMPGGRGFDVVGWVRRHPALTAVPLYVVSGSNLEVDMERSVTLGATEYLEKFPRADVL